MKDRCNDELKNVLPKVLQVTLEDKNVAVYRATSEIFYGEHNYSSVINEKRRGKLTKTCKTGFAFVDVQEKWGKRTDFASGKPLAFGDILDILQIRVIHEEEEKVLIM